MSRGSQEAESKRDPQSRFQQGHSSVMHYSLISYFNATPSLEKMFFRALHTGVATCQNGMPYVFILTYKCNRT